MKNIVIHFTTGDKLRMQSDLLDYLHLEEDTVFIMVTDAMGDKHLINMKEVTFIETV